ncbi:MAG: intermembrane phospholipid transport protein YdbH family protein [Desulfobacterales bacterium]
MFLKRHIAYPLIFLLLFILIAAGLIYLTAYLLPGVLESRIISILKKDVGISEFTVNLRELDLAGADLGPLHLGSQQNPALLIRSIQVDYSFGELYQKKIKNVVASGVEIYAEFKNGRLGLRGFDLEKLFAQLEAARSKNKTAGDRSGPSFPQRIEINNATFVCKINGTSYRVPFEIFMVAEDQTAQILNTTVHLYLRGQAVKITARVDLAQKRLAAHLAADRLNLSRFADLFEPVAGLRVAGLAELDANVALMLDPFSISSIRGRLKGSALKVNTKSLQLQTLSDAQQNEKPLIIDFERPAEPNWSIRISDFAAGAPLAARIADMTATVQSHADQYEIRGNFKLSFEPSAAAIMAPVPIRFKNPFDLPLEFSGRYSKNTVWQFGAVSVRNNRSDRNNATFDYDQIHVTTPPPKVDLTANGAGGDLTAAYTLQVPDVHISSGRVNIFSRQLVLNGETTIHKDRAVSTMSSIDLELSGGKLTANTVRIEANHLAAGYKLQIDHTGTRQVTGHVRFDGTHLTDTRLNIELAKAHGNIPLRFPAAPPAKAGIVEIEALRYQNLNLGSIKAGLQQTASDISFSGNLKSALIPALSAKFSGQTHLASFEDHETRAHYEIYYPETGPEVDLGKLLPAAAGFTFKGKLLEEGNLVIGKEGFNAAARSAISNGELRHRKNEIAIEAIQMDLLIPDLVKMRSAAGQKLKFARASLGEMNLENGEIDFQIESTQSVLVEKSHFIWCDGKVDAPAIRFTSGIEDYNLILYCDRLDLAKVLEQFGAASVKAEGQLNGRIPLRYQNGQLSFKDGFLFTTPGESGKIRMADTEILTAGIPQDTPQYVQMELARKALEDYDYTWAKLNLTTEGEDLLLKMQLDGKPAKSLPFVYQRDMGGFAKVEADVQGSTFQGIRLDVNFRLPLNKIMQYKELIQMIQKSRE